MGWVLFFMSESPDPFNIPFVAWSAFIQEMGSWVVACVVATDALILGAYNAHARGRKIRSPRDVFSPYKPMRWLWLAVVAALAMGIIYALGYQAKFPRSDVHFIHRAVPISLYTGGCTLLGAYLLMWIPGLTPTRYRYRPLSLIYRWRGAKNMQAEADEQR